jgi:nucleoside-diphosphate-sugar epimerase
MKDGRVVPNFIYQALRGEPLTVYGDGTQTRSFIYIDDLIGGLRRVIEHEYHFPINLGNPCELTVFEFAKKILELTGSTSPIQFYPLPEDDPRVREPDISKARELLGWEPRVSLDEGLFKTIEFFQQKLQRQLTLEKEMI